MGNKESTCYEFRKEEKVKGQKYLKQEAEEATSLTNPVKKDQNLSKDCKSMSAVQENDSSNDAYTPVRQNQQNKSFDSLNLWDPRSPTEGINRTPLHLNDDSDSFFHLDDPRSPSVGIDRTPIVQQNVESKDSIDCSVTDPRSPSVEFSRTPLTSAYPSEDLRRAVLVTNTFNPSPSSKKNKHFSDLPLQNAESPILKSNNHSERFVEEQSLVSDLQSNNEEDNKSCTDDLSLSLPENTEQSNEGMMNLFNDNLQNSIPKQSHTTEKSDDAFSNDQKLTDNLEYSEETVSGVGERNTEAFQTKPSENALSPKNLNQKNDAFTQTENQISSSFTSITRNKSKSLIPLNSMSSERKIKIKADCNKKNSRSKNENSNSFVSRKDKKFRQLQQSSPRSPLALISHNNSPEPKRLRVNETNSRNTGRTVSSRLPRYTSRSGDFNRS